MTSETLDENCTEMAVFSIARDAVLPEPEIPVAPGLTPLRGAIDDPINP